MKRYIEAVVWLKSLGRYVRGHTGIANVAVRAAAMLRTSLSIAGLAAITAVGVLYFNPHMAENLIALSPFAAEEQTVATDSGLAGSVSASVDSAFAATASASGPPAPKDQPITTLAKDPAAALLAKSAPVQNEQQRVSKWIAKRYRVATDAAGMLVGATYATAREVQLDPLLILAVIAIESRFNPFAESPVGAKGLMQVMAHIHRDRFQPLGGVQAALNPVANIQVGASILRDYVKRAGSLEGGLKMYVGAALHETDSGYGAKVIAEYNRLKNVAQGIKPASPKVTASAPKALKPPPTTQEAKNEEFLLSEPA